MQFVASVGVEGLSHLFDLRLDASGGFGVADVVCLYIGLGQQRIVERGQLRIEPKSAQRWEKRVVTLIVACLNMIGHKAADTRHDYAIIVEKQYLDMSFQFNHVCKVTTIFGYRQIKRCIFLLKDFFLL